MPAFLASAYVPVAAPLALGWMIAITLIAVGDAILSRRSARFELVRHVDEKLSLGAENRIRLTFRSRCGRTMKLLVKDSPPVAFDTPERLCSVLLVPYGEAEVTYRTTPKTRGDFTFGDLHVRGFGRLGLATWLRRVPAQAAVKVYPNLIEVANYELLARSDRLEQVGFRGLRRRGEGTQFESLRDYVPDDEFGNIDWKATARKRRPITREYEIERSQNLVLMLDAGRMMTAEIGGMSKLDYAVNAALMLAHVACSKDDAVGMIAFGRSVESFVPPRKGKAQVGRILDQLYALQPALEEPNYRSAFSLLTERSRKRALVVVFTDLVDADASQRLLAHVVALRPRYLPLLVTTRDADLEAAASKPPHEVEDVYQRAVAGNVLAAREQALAWMRSRGVLVLDVAPGKLTVSAVNEYLRLKGTGRL